MLNIVNYDPGASLSRLAFSKIISTDNNIWAAVMESVLNYFDTRFASNTSSASSECSGRLKNNVRYQYVLKSELIKAIARDDFELIYQPQMILDGGKIVAVEALLRWRSAELGIVSPGEFIPLAEKHGLIGELGNLVMDKACEQAGEWKKKYGSRLRVAVNVSYLQLDTPRIVEFVELCLKRYQLEQGDLEIELTESSLIGNKQLVVNIINDFRRLGIRTAIDDFGTGYSCLSCLATMPFDTIKIDRSFTAQLGVSEAGTRITRSIIDMGKNLGMEVLAEGVERLDQLEFLKDNACDLVQGNFICKPICAEQVPEWAGLTKGEHCD